MEIQTAEGAERLVIDRASIPGNTLAVGWPVAPKRGQYLVELPRETMSGTWRVWVKQSQILLEEETARAG